MSCVSSPTPNDGLIRKKSRRTTFPLSHTLLDKIAREVWPETKLAYSQGI